MEQRFRRQIPHNTNRNQQRETVATSITFRSNVGSAQPRDVFFQVDHKLETQTLFPYDCVGDTLRKPEPHRGGEITECSVGVATASRLQNWQTTSHVLFASPFFDTLAPVRHLDPRSSITIRPQGCVRCKTKPIIEFSVGFEQQVSSLLTWKSAMWVSEKCTSSQI